MEQFFAGIDYAGGEFVLFGTAHLLALSAVVLFNFALVQLKGQPLAQRMRVRKTIAVIVLLNELGWHVWNAATGQWTIQTMLPLHLCSVLVYLSAYVLFSGAYSGYEILYFLGIGGALQALLTPDLGIYGFPHFRFWQTFISHGIIVTTGVYFTLVEGLRPTLNSIKRVFIRANIYLLLVTMLNFAIGGNYLFTAHKPYTPSLLDLLPNWPWYILWMEVIGVVTCLLLYLPFAVYDWRVKHGWNRLQNVQ